MAFNTKAELIQQLKQLKQALQAKWPIESFALFGSWVRGDATLQSDVDLLISFKRPNKISLFDFMDILHELEDALGCKVDLVEKEALKPRLKPSILAEAVDL